MKKIYKYTLDVRDEQEIEMPFGACILHAGVQDGKICLWASVNPSREPCKRKIQIFGTGHPLTGAGAYIGTVQVPPMVWHIFEASGD